MNIQLTQAEPAYEFSLSIGGIKRIATSGVIGASPATVKLQQRVSESDDWVDVPGVNFAEGVHLSGVLYGVAQFNRVVVTDPDGTTAINLSL